MPDEKHAHASNEFRWKKMRRLFIAIATVWRMFFELDSYPNDVKATARHTATAEQNEQFRNELYIVLICCILFLRQPSRQPGHSFHFRLARAKWKLCSWISRASLAKHQRRSCVVPLFDTKGISQRNVSLAFFRLALALAAAGFENRFSAPTRCRRFSETNHISIKNPFSTGFSSEWTDFASLCSYSGIDRDGMHQPMAHSLVDVCRYLFFVAWMRHVMSLRLREWNA